MKKNQVIKKLMSWLLLATMVITMIPNVAVFAEDGTNLEYEPPAVEDTVGETETGNDLSITMPEDSIPSEDDAQAGSTSDGTAASSYTAASESEQPVSVPEENAGSVSENAGTAGTDTDIVAESAVPEAAEPEEPAEDISETESAPAEPSKTEENSGIISETSSAQSAEDVKEPEEAEENTEEKEPAVDVSDHPLVEVEASDDEPLLAIEQLSPRTLELLGLAPIVKTNTSLKKPDL